MRPFRAQLALLLAALTLLWPTIPAVQAGNQLTLFEFSVKDEKELGEKFAMLVKTKLPLVEDPEIKGWCKGIVERLHKEMPAIPFDVDTNVLLNNAVNAFAAPAGYIFIHTGLILNFDKESDVAGVVAHELAHVSQRHLASRIERSQTINLLSLAGVLAGALIGGNMGEAVIAGSAAGAATAQLAYSREDEAEADQVGMSYLTKAGYPPQGMVGAFERMRKLRWITGSGGFPTYLSTHPAIDERIQTMSARLERLPPQAKTIKEDPERFERIKMLIRAHYTTPDIALNYYIKKDGKPSRLDLLGKAIVLARLNKMIEAQAAFDDALAKGGGDPLFEREAGRFAFKKGDFPTAQAKLDSAMRKNPDDIMALYFIARLQAESGEHQRAADNFKRVLLAVPEDAEIHQLYGLALGRSEKTSLAHTHLAYAFLYQNNKQKTLFHREKAEKAVRTEEDRREYAKFVKIFEARKKIWEALRM